MAFAQSPVGSGVIELTGARIIDGTGRARDSNRSISGSRLHDSSCATQSPRWFSLARSFEQLKDTKQMLTEKAVTTSRPTSLNGRRNMVRLRIAVAASMLACSFAIAQSANHAVLRLDPALDALVSSDARVELVKSGFGFTEGPVWVQQGRQGYLLFTDIPGNVVWKLTADGVASVYLEHVGYNGPEVWRWGGIQNNGFDKG
jgi:hypothetical protein